MDAAMDLAFRYLSRQVIHRSASHIAGRTFRRVDNPTED